VAEKTIERPGADAWVPAGGGIPALRKAAHDCRGCELWEPATQVVFSKGSPLARVVLVGEQPGDQEDRQGEPFVGPAGRLLDKALAEVGIDSADTYVTNAVKHFRFTPTAKRRLHRTPDLVHLVACRPWLSAELEIVDPEVLVCLGATAIRAVLGPSIKVTRDRGQLMPWSGGLGDEPATRRAAWSLVTIHPSAVLRADDRDKAYEGLVADLAVVAGALVGESRG
jgi:uracil-DNA glycosylase